MGGTSFDEEGKQMILSRLNKAAARQARILFHNYCTYVGKLTPVFMFRFP